jgi:hypothetical protein
MSRYKITAWVLIFSGWLLYSLAGAGTLPGIGGLSASFKGELSGAGNPIIWHVDLLPEG